MVLRNKILFLSRYNAITYAMKKHYSFALLLLFACNMLPAQNISLLTDKGAEVTLKNTAGAYPVATRAVNGTNYLHFAGERIFTMQNDAPALPVYRTSVIVPNTGEVSITVEYDSYQEFTNVNILPSKGSLKRNVNPDAVPYAFGRDYQQDSFYPGSLAQVSSPYILRDTRGATVTFNPYQYNPVTKVLRHYKNITVRVVTGTQGGANTRVGTSSVSGKAFAPIYRQHYINAARLLSDEAPDTAEMLIVAPDAYLESISALAEWKNLRGLKTTIASLTTIGATPQDIKQYVQEFYADNPALTYVLLVGDHQDLPSHTYGITGAGEELWSDTYYAQLEGDDFFPEVLVGRFSGTVADVAVMVNRTLEYELNPMEGDWVTKAAGIASNEGDGYGDDGEPDWQHLRNIGDKLLEHGYTFIHEFYDGSQGGNDLDDSPQYYMIADAVNEGIGLLNYTGHGAQDVFATGGFTSNDVYGLQNIGKYPFVVSVACNNGTFANGNSLCESWLTAQYMGAPTGAIAACGSSILMAWAEPMQTQDEMAELITLSNPENIKTTLGELFYAGQVSMLETYGLSTTATEVMQTWVFFGDPSVVYRNSPAENIAATHPDAVQLSEDALTVQCETEGAFVAVTQNGVQVGSGIVVNGQVVITLEDFDASAPLTVTITQQNYIPYVGEVQVETLSAAEFTGSSIAIYPNPAQDHITVSLPAAVINATVQLHDISGKLLYTSGSIGGGNHNISTDTYAAGLYFVSVHTSNGTLVQKVIKK